jgi:hypothetical protein
MTYRDHQLSPNDYIDLHNCAAKFMGTLITYSGRGMYGETCIGITTNVNPALFTMRLMYDLCTGIPYSVLPHVLATSLMYTDDMGKGSVVYWPGIAAEGETE